MMNRLAVVALSLATGLVFGCGAPRGTVFGKVIADGAPVASQLVVLQSANGSATASTGADGSYAFPEVAEGTYVLTVDVTATRELHQQVAVAVKGDVQMPDLTFTGVATITGTLTDAAGTPVANTEVALLGTSLAARTDGAGHFTLTDAPVGTHTLFASSSSGRVQTDVTLARGDAKDVALVLAVDPSTRAVINGSVGFFANTDRSVVEISAPAAGVSTQASVDGDYTLSLPAGEWDLVARAPHYPDQTIGHVSAVGGQTVTMAPYTLSLYQPLPDFGLPDGIWQLVNFSFFGQPARGAVLLSQTVPGSPTASYYALDVATGALRLVSVGSSSSMPPILSPTGHFAVLPNVELNLSVVENLLTGDNFSVTTAQPVTEVQFADGDTAVFLVGYGSSPSSFDRVNLSDRSVVSAQGYDIHWLDPNRVLVRTTNASPYAWQLFTPTQKVTAFNNVPTLVMPNGYGAGGTMAYGVEACSTLPCPVDVLGAQATQAIQIRSMTASSNPTNVVGQAPWMVLNNGGQLVLVNSVDGTSTALPAGATDVTISFGGIRIAYMTASGKQLFEHALPLPDPSTITPVVTSNGAITGAYVSATHYVGFNETPVTGAPYVVDIQAGTYTTLADGYTAGSRKIAPGAASWQAADGTARLVVGDAPVFTAPPGVSGAPVVVQAQVSIVPSNGGWTIAPGNSLAAQWADKNLWLLRAGAAPRPFGYEPNVADSPVFFGNAILSNSAQATLIDADSGQRVVLIEPDRPNGFRDDISVPSGNSVFVACGLNAAGVPAHCSYAVIDAAFL